MAGAGRLVLFTPGGALAREALVESARKMGVAGIAVPLKIRLVDAMPLLGTAKTGYVALKKLAETLH